MLPTGNFPTEKYVLIKIRVRKNKNKVKRFLIDIFYYRN